MSHLSFESVDGSPEHSTNIAPSKSFGVVIQCRADNERSPEAKTWLNFFKSQDVSHWLVKLLEIRCGFFFRLVFLSVSKKVAPVATIEAWANSSLVAYLA